jgi:phage tail-like protein
MTFARAALLPPVPEPPHDPRTIRLDPRGGWRAAALDGVSAAGPGLRLCPAEGGWAANGADGSFGGLTLPKTMARAPDGAVLALDPATGLIARFDGCACAFRAIPATGGKGPGARQFDRPVALAAVGEALLVADPGRGRVVEFGLYGYPLRGALTPPPDAAPWQPTALAARRGLIAVGDAASGSVHLIGPGRVWRAIHAGFGAITALAWARQGRLLIAAEQTAEIAVLDPKTGARLAGVAGREALRRALPRPPFATAFGGAVDLGPLCDTPRTAWHGPTGLALAAPPAAPGLAALGTYLSRPLDSRIAACVWDRVSLHLALPEGARVRVATTTAETPRTDDEIASLPESAWSEAPTVRATEQGRWDALIRSDPGRHLWLRLRLLAGPEQGPTICAAEIDFPRITLRRYLPTVFGAEPVSADFTDRFLAIFDRTQRSLEARIDRLARNFDPASAPEPWLDWLATWVGVTLDRGLPLSRRRAILAEAGRLFGKRGTKAGLRALLETVLGLPTSVERDAPCCAPCAPEAPAWRPPGLILEHFTLRRWMELGHGRLGDDAKLWGERIVGRSRLASESGAQLGVTRLDTLKDPHRDPFHVYAHRLSVFLPARLGREPGRRRRVERLIRDESPAHAQATVQWVEPRFRVGIQAMIGFDSAIGCYPQGITLNEAKLGRATVLSPAPGQDRGRPRLGRHCRIGGAAL